MVVAIIGLVGGIVALVGNTVKANKERAIQADAIEAQNQLALQQRIQSQIDFVTAKQGTQRIIDIVLLIVIGIAFLLLMYYMLKRSNG